MTVTSRETASQPEARPVLTILVLPGPGAVAAAERLAPLGDATLVAVPSDAAGQELPAGARPCPVPPGAEAPQVRAALLARATTPWVLWADPELDYEGSDLGLWCALAAAREPVLVVRSTDPLGSEGPQVVVHRRTAGSWTGRTRPRLIDAAGARVPTQLLPAVALTARRTTAVSEADRAQRRAAAVALAARDVEDTPTSDALLVLARCQHDAGLLAEAVATADRLADTHPGTDDARAGLDLAATALLVAGHDAAALGYVDRLRAQGGVERGYTDWLAAQALAQLGRGVEAHDLAGRLDVVRDTAGNEVPRGVLRETRALIAVSAGRMDAGIEDLIVAMAVHGHISGRGPLLKELWTVAGRTDDLLAALVAAGPAREAALRRELGVEVAA